MAPVHGANPAPPTGAASLVYAHAHTHSHMYTHTYTHTHTELLHAVCSASEGKHPKAPGPHGRPSLPSGCQARFIEKGNHRLTQACVTDTRECTKHEVTGRNHRGELPVGTVFAAVRGSQGVTPELRPQDREGGLLLLGFRIRMTLRPGSLLMAWKGGRGPACTCTAPRRAS